MVSKLYKRIYKEIRKYNMIVIARHVGADPDALGSSIGLKEIILQNFPNKKVYAIGCPASRFRYFGILDRFDDSMYENALLIVTDTPDKRRVDGVDVNKFKNVIKIDHHPFIESFDGIEWIDDKASSASQMIIEFAFHTKLRIPVSAAEKLYIGLVADTNRFSVKLTTPKTFQIVSRLIDDTKIDIVPLYEKLYTRPIKEVKFQGFVTNNFKITENGFGYVYINDEMLNEYEVDAATAGNMVNNFNYIDEMIAWATFSEDKNNSNIRVSIRSRGPIINEAASKFGGGGHIYASGVKLSSFNDCDALVEELDKICMQYKENSL